MFKKRFKFFVIIFAIALVTFLFFDDELRKLNPFRPANSALNTQTLATNRIVPKSESATTQLSSKPSEKMRLATFNIRMFTSNSREDAELAKICDVLERYDVIAIQELRDTAVLDRAKAMLASRGKNYGSLVSKAVGSRMQKELYAILYRTDKITPLDEGTTYADFGDQFIREPFYATLKCGNFDFTLITVHLLYKDKKAPERQIELTAIGNVFDEIQKFDKRENDVILTGDFNEEPDSPRFFRLREIQDIVFLVNGVKTTISDSSTYDQIIFQSSYTGAEYTGEWGMYKFDEEMFGGDDSLASRTISDHRPVWADFFTNRDDDD